MSVSDEGYFRNVHIVHTKLDIYLFFYRDEKLFNVTLLVYYIVDFLLKIESTLYWIIKMCKA
jgi:hypothetical protein